MTLAQDPPRAAYAPLSLLLGCVLVVAVALTWTYRGMRAVMDVGGSCASGGPYEIAQPCPSGAVLISIAIPVLVATALLGSWLAMRLAAPTLLLSMWALLFGSLGWNFLDYGFGSDGVVWGWAVCGVMFELMALPAVVVMVAGDRLIGTSSLGTGSLGTSSLGTGRAATERPGPAAWYAAYVVLAAAGAAVGWWSFDALS